ncbi:YjcQ family protein [Mammaliicoccus sciuri]|uniref:YjcQ family protein n=1 Tax=Mammaliicoccus TaxID=2803850 RepID=UPI001E53522A|nr:MULTISPECIES: YjcQ family protein [Mammaliicoccus]MCD8810015.1 YjcQ family protein [Mammaliicoccus sciuri]
MNKQKLRYAMLKEVDKGKIRITADDFGIDQDDFTEQAFFLKREGYITGYSKGDNLIWFDKGITWITESGEKYLRDNSALGKSYNLAKEIRDWIK